MQTIEERLAGLERSNRRLRGAGVVCGMLLVGVLVVGANQEAEPKRRVFEELVAKAIRIVDNRGATRIAIGVPTARDPLIVMGSPDGIPSITIGSSGITAQSFAVRRPGDAGTQVRLSASDVGGMLSINDLLGNTRIGALADNGTGYGFMSISGGKGNSPSITLAGGSSAYINTYDNGNKTLSISSTESGEGTISTYNKQGNELVMVTATEDGGAGMVVTLNGQGKALVRLSSVAGDGLHAGTGSVMVFDPTGRTKRGALLTRE